MGQEANKARELKKKKIDRAIKATLTLNLHDKVCEAVVCKYHAEKKAGVWQVGAFPPGFAVASCSDILQISLSPHSPFVRSVLAHIPHGSPGSKHPFCTQCSGVTNKQQHTHIIDLESYRSKLED